MNNFAIAHAMKKKARKMAEGGGVNEKEDRLTGSKNARTYSNQSEQEGVHTANHRMKLELPMAEGGCVEEPCPGCESCLGDEGYQDGDEPMDQMIKKIMMSRGGMVANEDQGESASDPDQMAKDMPNEFDDLALNDDLSFDSTGANSGDELGDTQEDHDRHDIVMRVLKSRAKKDRMPRPA